MVHRAEVARRGSERPPVDRAAWLESLPAEYQHAAAAAAVAGRPPRHRDRRLLRRPRPHCPPPLCHRALPSATASAPGAAAGTGPGAWPACGWPNARWSAQARGGTQAAMAGPVRA
ncbi:MAG: hypothetical protein M0C28_31175 [Candidatus Moduliflexus flocculans]|nr:hypothetical protein [Candidatus Moduliflexus flocculans]